MFRSYCKQLWRYILSVSKTFVILVGKFIKNVNNFSYIPTAQLYVKNRSKLYLIATSRKTGSVSNFTWQASSHTEAMEEIQVYLSLDVRFVNTKMVCVPVWLMMIYKVLQALKKHYTCIFLHIYIFFPFSISITHLSHHDHHC